MNSETSLNLENKIAIVSAAGRGIGKGIAKTLAAAGATVVVNSYSEDTTQETVDEIQAKGGTAKAMPGDITEPEKILDVVDTTLAEFGQIDILVNNVGAGPKSTDQPPDHPLGPVEGLWNALYKQNLLPVVLMTEAVVPHMQSRRYGKIINISSIAGRSSFSAQMLRNFVPPSYGAMKAALVSYTQTLADMLGPDNINVNAVCPGIVYTDSWKGNAERAVKAIPEFKGLDAREWFEGIFRDDYPLIFDRTPLQREQTVEDIGNAVKFLVSDESLNITGQSLMVDGGMVKL
ncbi:MAG: SDR family oxidoreductase [Gammaproteobacteria bacterium]|nr:SDR family oxidoreductase [Gammaproteobacteria bacterium]MBT4494888.1 SDR family oxidoreductase [Gammaproteobacteria bacterium]MBT7371884.1 SDR family oxidoreductase [Gammaproteobacteria bacterium]